MENTTVIWDVKCFGLTEKTATLEMKQSTKLPRHHVPENHKLHIHFYLNLRSQNMAATGTHSNDQQLWSKNAGNWQKWEEEEKIRGEQEDKGNNRSVTGRIAGCSNNYQSHICKSMQVKFQRNTGAVILCHEDIMRE